jgi:phosphate/sulfate permease
MIIYIHIDNTILFNTINFFTTLIVAIFIIISIISFHYTDFDLKFLRKLFETTNQINKNKIRKMDKNKYKIEQKSKIKEILSWKFIIFSVYISFFY